MDAAGAAGTSRSVTLRQRNAAIVVVATAAVLYGWGIGGEGWGNLYYAASVRSMSRSWSNFFFGAFDPKGLVTTDKPPLSQWIQVGFVRVFGFHGWVLMLPQAIEGAATVAVLYLAVRRWSGHRAALLAAVILTFTPIVVAINRDNNPDTLLMLCLVAAAYFVTRALQEDRLRWILLTGVMIGLGALTKSLTAWMILPAIGVSYLVAAPARLVRRIGALALLGVVVMVGSLWWPTAVDLVPKSNRPYVESSTDDRELNLVLVTDGLDRVIAPHEPSAPAHSPAITAAVDAEPAREPVTGNPGPTRLFGVQFGGQIAWLLPLAVICCLAGCFSAWRRSTSWFRRGGWLFWSIWLAVACGVISDGNGIGHLYYANEIAPALAATTGAGLVIMARAWRDGDRLGWLLPVGMGIETVAATLLARRHVGSLPWLAPTILACGGIAVVVILLSRGALGDRLSPERLRGVFVVAAVLGLIAILVGPVTWAVLPLGAATAGSDPRAGPPGNVHGTAALVDAVRPVLSWTERHARGAPYELALPSTQEAGAWIVAGGNSVVGLGGYTGREPAPPLFGLVFLLRIGAIHYVLVNIKPPRSSDMTWITHTCTRDPGRGIPARSIPLNHYRLYRC